MAALRPEPGSLHARLVEEGKRLALADWYSHHGYRDVVAVLRKGLAA